MRTTTARLATRSTAVGALTVALVALLTTTALAAPILHGTYTTPLRAQGTISYTPVRAFHGGSEGTFKVDGKGYPGSVYAATGGGTGMVWYYGTSGIMKGNALVTLQSNGTYSGPIWFFDRKGNTIDSGTTTVTFP
jgi:hypothetical protein